MQEMTAAYADARSRNRERYRCGASKKCAAMRAAKERKRLESGDAREATWTLPDLRRIVVVIDFDSGRPLVRMMQLWRGERIDNYRVRSPKGSARKPAGWSSVLAAVRKKAPTPRSVEC